MIIMAQPNWRQIYARKRDDQKRSLKVCPDCPETSGIYFILREENGFKFGYVGQAENLLDRLASHLQGYKSHIDKSLRSHGLYDAEKNPTGYKIAFKEYPKAELDIMEQYYIKKCANEGWQMRNVESGGKSGKTDIGERQPSRGYRDGLTQGEKNARKFVADLFAKHLTYAPKPKSGKFPTENQLKAMQKFEDFLKIEEENPHE